jgi:membrane-bound serine protease (ClpP class)
LLITAIRAPHLSAQTEPAKWLEVHIGIIGAASEETLREALDEAKGKGYAGLLLVLDTPGGALEATRGMVENMLSSPLPIVVWVGPSGARAASAGAFITLAGHIAAMAPGTNIGAATPITMGGQDADANKDGKRKIENDTRAFIESIADLRGRNREMAASFVVNALSITANEALEHKVIDVVAANRDDLFTAIDKREVTLEHNRKIVLSTKGAVFDTFKKSLRGEFLEILSNPNLFYLLFLAGIIGIGIELTHPGVIFPGVMGGICLILALIATSVLPVNFGAMLLILISVAFMIAETFVPSFGVLGVGGFIGFIIGSVLLVDPRNEMGLRIAWMTIIPGALFVAGFAMLVSYLIVKAGRSRVVSGAEGMVGLAAEVLNDFVDGQGQVRVSGEIWNAVLQNRQDTIRRGERVEICAVKGLELEVKPSRS